MRSDPLSTPGGRLHPRVLIIDDHEIFRAACRALLRTQGINVIADVPAGEQAVTAAITRRPDVAIVDVTPTDSGGLGIARRLTALPNPPAIVLTSSTDRAQFGSALDGYAFIAKADICSQAIADAANARQQPSVGRHGLMSTAREDG